MDKVTLPKEVADRLNDIADNYSFNDLLESGIPMELKIQVLYESGKGYRFGQSSAWTEAIEKVLDILEIYIEGVNA